ncbi:protein FAM177A1 [Gadus chalcogrammus]|uniref:protein FAM177A1 n=1 Tax=Gadus chalcogrammus TaxID=1042646 RepID=UPI0024C49754|nr:protein FAM177A1 [Gadus chalcogrammus]
MEDRQERRVVHFASGETMEEEEDEEDPTHETLREPSERIWRSWRKTGGLVMKMTLCACDFLGARLASLLGLDSAKYQYAIDLHRRRQPQRRDDPQVPEDLSGARGERIVLSTRPDRTYSATEPRTVGQGAHNEAFQHDRDP